MIDKETAKRLKVLIVENKHSEAIEAMFNLVNDEEADGLHILASRLNRLNDQILKDTISKDQANLEFNKITEAAINYTDKIGRNQRLASKPSYYSKEVIKHDIFIFEKLEDVLDFETLDVVVDDLVESFSCKIKEKEKLEIYFQFLRHPSNEFLIEGIIEKKNLHFEALNKLLILMDDYFDDNALQIFNDKVGLSYLKISKKHNSRFPKKVIQKKLEKLALDVLNTYKEFRSEIKRNLII